MCYEFMCYIGYWLNMIQTFQLKNGKKLNIFKQLNYKFKTL